MTGLPAKISDEFNARHMEMVWEELRVRFGFNVATWKRMFRNEFSKQPRNVTEVEFFLIFGNRNINDLLNRLLCRRLNHPTFNALVFYVIERSGQPSSKASSGYSNRRATSG
ncbi:MAG TPA: hypothetical protein VKZ86_13305 [Cyclobacteriaceae bacterium]|nr:hypothetical protein [Cyclobacteriaceae bacterium]